MIRADLRLLEPFMAKEKFIELVKPIEKVLLEDVLFVLPSINLGADGPALGSIYLVSENFLCELKVSHGNSTTEFDFVYIRTVGNYRTFLWTNEVRQGEVVVATYEMAKVSLVHAGNAPEMRSEISYCGLERESWINSIHVALPLKLLLPS